MARSGLALVLSLLTSGCLSRAQYDKDRALAGSLAQQFQDESDRVACLRGGVIEGSMDYLRCRLDRNAKRLEKVKAQTIPKKQP